MSQARIEKERLASELAVRAEAAFARAGLTERHFSLHGHRFVLRCAGREIADNLSRALAHLATAPGGKVELTIDCWDAAATGVDYPTPDWPTHRFAARGEIHGLDGGAMRIAYFAWLKLLNVYFPALGRAYYCLTNARPFPVQQFGSPALTIFSWWLGTLGWQLTHAAAVGTAEGGLLIAGHGGAGKSTLAFSTLGSALRYVSDDYTVVMPGNPPAAVALYSSGKLDEASVDLLPHLRGSMANAETFPSEKALFFLHEKFPDRHLPHTLLRAIILSEVNETETTLERACARDVREIIARSTLIQLAGSSPHDLARVIKLLYPLPVYLLRHGKNRAETHRLLLRLCAS